MNQKNYRLLENLTIPDTICTILPENLIMFLSSWQVIILYKKKYLYKKGNRPYSLQMTELYVDIL